MFQNRNLGGRNSSSAKDVAKRVLRIHVACTKHHARFLTKVVYSTHGKVNRGPREQRPRGAHVRDVYLYTASTSHSDRHKTTRYGPGSSRDDVGRNRFIAERMKTWPLAYLLL